MKLHAHTRNIKNIWNNRLLNNEFLFLPRVAIDRFTFERRTRVLLHDHGMTSFGGSRVPEGLGILEGAQQLRLAQALRLVHMKAICCEEVFVAFYAIKISMVYAEIRLAVPF